jgi:transcriptional regulator GlxA family with amidase domain
MTRIFTSIILLATLLVAGCSPIKEFSRVPEFTGIIPEKTKTPMPDAKKKTILLLAYNRGTEIFDLMAPFNLFNLTEQANVYIVAPEKGPIAVMQGFFTLPHYTFRGIDSLKIQPSVIVIPNFSAMGKTQQDPVVVNWIRSKYTDTTIFLSVCAGSFTAAATGLYDGKALTTHASDIQLNMKLFSAPAWTTAVTYTKAGNLYSTAGVSNATEGSLAMIRDVFGEQTMQRVMKQVYYPHATLRTNHESIAIDGRNKKHILSKVLFKKDDKVAVLLQEGVDEFKLAAILDAYHRTFPATLHTYAVSPEGVTSRFGLRIMPSAHIQQLPKSDEVHILSQDALSEKEKQAVGKLPVVQYNPQSTRYIYDECLDRIKTKLGSKMHTVTKRLLDYY